MAITLELPPHLEEELTHEAEKEGVAPSEHAALLLSICTALLKDVEATPFREAVRTFLSRRALDAEHLSTVFEELVAECLAAAPGDEELSRTIRRARYVSEPGRAGPAVVAGLARPSAVGRGGRVQSGQARGDREAARPREVRPHPRHQRGLRTREAGRDRPRGEAASLNHVLDACAMLAYLNGETGAESVEALLADPDEPCFAHSVNLCEVYYDFLRRADQRTAREAISDLLADGVVERRDLARRF